ncbi:MAG: hypothetical protein WAJ87_23850 [Bryobacteraceae bacterium]
MKISSDQGVVSDPKKEIEQVAEAEAGNLRSSLRFLGERSKLASDVLCLYNLITRSVEWTSAPTEEEQQALFVMLMLTAGCRFQLTMSVLQNWRGRMAEALAPLRRASELCASACHIRRNPGLATIWLSVSKGDEAYKRHKDAFKLKAIFPKDDPTLSRLFGIFDSSSKLIHCSLYSLASQVRDAGFFRYFDIAGPTEPALIRTYIHIVSAHELMLRAFIDAFGGALTDAETVKAEFKVFSERLQRHRDSHRELAMSDIPQAALDRAAKRQRSQTRDGS